MPIAVSPSANRKMVALCPGCYRGALIEERCTTRLPDEPTVPDVLKASRQQHDMDESAQRKSVLPLALGALGVVYGDIGTSPLYTFKEVPQIGIPLDQAHIVGAFSRPRC
jgi:hypothetical protein